MYGQREDRVKLLRLSGLLAATICVPVDGGVLALEPLQERMTVRIEGLAADPFVGDASLAAVPLLTEFYARRDFRPAWNDAATVDELIRLIGEVDQVGLDPDDYHLGELKRLTAATRGAVTSDPMDQVNLDILLTESLARLGYHSRFGKVDPRDLDSDWNLSRSLDGKDPVEMIQSAIDSGSLERFAAERIVYLPFYDRLKATLAEYREIEQRGGWPEVPPGPSLRPDSVDGRVIDLRRRLKATGDLAAGAADSERFDEGLEAAVKRFQRRHRLTADGIVGTQSIEALNVPVGERIDQIRVNLERVRWVFRDVGDDFLVVNIAGFELWLFRDGELVWRAMAQVGKPYRRTPVFKAEMKYLVFSPTWTVPPGIRRKDVLPAVIKDPGYLRQKNMNIIDREGNVVPVDSIDWPSVTVSNFRYNFRQEPGPNNALGRVKFIFPNSHFVFLHDTPSKHLFDRADRAFSSGCIRVKDPMQLAELLLNDAKKWNGDRIDEALESGKTRTVFLPEPLPVMLLYWTVHFDEETGAPHFIKDIYGRDRQVLTALDEGFVFRAPEDAPAWAP
jgi:murein L,D-transpeptidase YcbB/YkuD